MERNCQNRGSLPGTIAVLLCALLAPHSAQAGVNFTSGRVYMQQKVYDKACHFLELARQEEPGNPQIYALLGIARAQQRQYASAGASFQIGLKVATEKKDKKRSEEIERNRSSVYVELFNRGINALNRAGAITEDDSRTTDAGTPQARVEKERGEPKDFGRFTEGGKVHEFWYYPGDGLAFHFTPGGTEPLGLPYKPFRGAPDPNNAVTDTTVFHGYSGASVVAEAAYIFEIAMLVDPSAADDYKNLSYLYEVLGRPDDAIRAAQKGLALSPNDKQLVQNLRVAAMGRGNRLFASGKYADAVPAYRVAMAFDSSGTLRYLSRIAESFQLAAGGLDAGAQQAALFDSAAATYMQVVEKAPADSIGLGVKENSLYNAALIKVRLEKYPEAVQILDQGVAMFPKSRDLLSVSGQTKYQTNDFDGSVAAMRRVLELDPKDKDAHQFLFLALNKQNKKDESVAEYTIYKALSDGKMRTGSQLKQWVDSADNRLGANHQLKNTFTADGYPEEVRTFAEDDKMLETWFYWSKGKAVTFLEGQIFSKASFPPMKG